MDEHERNLANEQAKDYAELHKIRETLVEKMTHWDKNLNESKDHVRQAIRTDAEKQIKEIEGRACCFALRIFSIVRI